MLIITDIKNLDINLMENNHIKDLNIKNLYAKSKILNFKYPKGQQQEAENFLKEPANINKILLYSFCENGILTNEEKKRYLEKYHSDLFTSELVQKNTYSTTGENLDINQVTKGKDEIFKEHRSSENLKIKDLRIKVRSDEELNNFVKQVNKLYTSLKISSEYYDLLDHDIENSNKYGVVDPFVIDYGNFHQFRISKEIDLDFFVANGDFLSQLTTKLTTHTNSENFTLKLPIERLKGLEIDKLKVAVGRIPIILTIGNHQSINEQLLNKLVENFNIKKVMPYIYSAKDMVNVVSVDQNQGLKNGNIVDNLKIVTDTTSIIGKEHSYTFHDGQIVTADDNHQINSDSQITDKMLSKNTINNQDQEKQIDSGSAKEPDKKLDTKDNDGLTQVIQESNTFATKTLDAPTREIGNESTQIITKLPQQFVTWGASIPSHLKPAGLIDEMLAHKGQNILLNVVEVSNKNMLIQKFMESANHVFLAHDPDSLAKTSHAINVGANNEIIINEGQRSSELEKFIEKSGDIKTIIVDLDNFKDEAGKLKSLLQKDRKIWNDDFLKEYPDLQIIALSSQDVKQEGFDLIVKVPDKITKQLETPELGAINKITIDLYGQSNGETMLKGQTKIDGDKIYDVPGELLKKLQEINQNNSDYKLEIVNAPKSESLTSFLRNIGNNKNVLLSHKLIDVSHIKKVTEKVDSPIVTKDQINEKITFEVSKDLADTTVIFNNNATPLFGKTTIKDGEFVWHQPTAETINLFANNQVNHDFIRLLIEKYPDKKFHIKVPKKDFIPQDLFSNCQETNNDQINSSSNNIQLYTTNNYPHAIKQIQDEKKDIMVLNVDEMGALFTKVSPNNQKEGLLKFDLKQSDLAQIVNQNNQQEILLYGNFSPDQVQEIINFNHKANNGKLNLLVDIKQFKNNKFKSTELFNWFDGENHSISLADDLPQNQELKKTLDLQTQDDRKKALSTVFNKDTFVKITGKTGVGKSEFIKELNESADYAVYNELTELKKWSQDDTKKTKVLIIDEANMHSSDFSFFNTINYNNAPFIYYNGEKLEIDSNHKVMFVYNPIKVGYTGQREEKPFIQETNIQELEFTALKDVNKIYTYVLAKLDDNTKFENLFKEIIKKWQNVNKNCSDEVSFRHLEMMALVARSENWTDKNDAGKAVAAVVNSMLTPTQIHKLSQTLDSESNQAQKEYIKHDSFVVSPNWEESYAAVQQFLKICKFRKQNSELDSKGLAGLTIRGGNGTGKSKLVEHLETKHKNLFVVIDASMTAEERDRMTDEAFKAGKILIIKQANTLPQNEAKLNPYMMGIDLDGKPTDHSGFGVIFIENPAKEDARIQKSEALQARAMTVNVAQPIKEETMEITKILYPASNIDFLYLLYEQTKKFAKEKNKDAVPDEKTFLDYVANDHNERQDKKQFDNNLYIEVENSPVHKTIFPEPYEVKDAYYDRFSKLRDPGGVKAFRIDKNIKNVHYSDKFNGLKQKLSLKEGSTYIKLNGHATDNLYQLTSLGLNTGLNSSDNDKIIIPFLSSRSNTDEDNSFKLTPHEIVNFFVFLDNKEQQLVIKLDACGAKKFATALAEDLYQAGFKNSYIMHYGLESAQGLDPAKDMENRIILGKSSSNKDPKKSFEESENDIIERYKENKFVAYYDEHGAHNIPYHLFKEHVLIGQDQKPPIGPYNLLWQIREKLKDNDTQTNSFIISLITNLLNTNGNNNELRDQYITLINKIMHNEDNPVTYEARLMQYVNYLLKYTKNILPINEISKLQNQFDQMLDNERFKQTKHLLAEIPQDFFVQQDVKFNLKITNNQNREVKIDIMPIITTQTELDELVKENNNKNGKLLGNEVTQDGMSEDEVNQNLKDIQSEKVIDHVIAPSDVLATIAQTEQEKIFITTVTNKDNVKHAVLMRIQPADQKISIIDPLQEKDSSFKQELATLQQNISQANKQFVVQVEYAGVQNCQHGTCADEALILAQNLANQEIDNYSNDQRELQKFYLKLGITSAEIDKKQRQEAFKKFQLLKTVKVIAQLLKHQQQELKKAQEDEEIYQRLKQEYSPTLKIFDIDSPTEGLMSKVGQDYPDQNMNSKIMNHDLIVEFFNQKNNDNQDGNIASLEKFDHDYYISDKPICISNDNLDFGSDHASISMA